jgi:hypothetical protein
LNASYQTLVDGKVEIDGMYLVTTKDGKPQTERINNE